uniref:Ig-like domain-containing protein n=1 Tax=Astyanax mexicanus TaxID=7994 RepID=W5KI26_ASTMX
MAAAPRSGFKLVGRDPEKAPVGSTVILYCYLSPKISAEAMEIRWFKEMDCICLYKDREMKVGRGYTGRVNLFTHELERGNVSLLLRECKGSDIGHYLCQVTCGDRTEELTTRVWWRPLQKVFGFSKGGIPYVSIEQWFRKWTQDERLKMEDSALLLEHNTDVKSLQKELKERQSLLEMSAEQLRNVKLDWERAEEELQRKSTQVQMTVVVLEQLKTELAEKTKQLEEKDRLLTELNTMLTDREKQTEEKERHLEEMRTKLQEFTDSSAEDIKTYDKELENQTSK